MSKYEGIKRLKYAKDPIFAPITYGDDRSVTRTRRGIHCQIENELNPSLVYCRCMTCKYEWVMDKLVYVTGTARLGNRPNPMVTKNVGIGGTGIIIGNFPMPKYDNKLHYPNVPPGFTTYFQYDEITGQFSDIKQHSVYNILAHDSSYCKNNTIKCKNGLMYTCDFYPLRDSALTADGELNTDIVADLYFDPADDSLKGNPESFHLEDPIPVFTECTEDIEANYHVGGSGTHGGGNETNPITGTTISAPKPRKFGGHPMCCPNCCRVNFLAKWLEPNDRPYPYENYPHKKPPDIPSNVVNPPNLNEWSEYRNWLMSNRHIKTIQFEEASTTWYVEDKSIFCQHVALLIFDQYGRVLHENEILKVNIDHICGGLRVMFSDPMVGYVWVLKPTSDMKEYIDNIDKVCTGIIVRDYQRIKSHTF